MLEQNYKGISTEWDVTENHKYRLTTGVWSAIIFLLSLMFHHCLVRLCYQCFCVWQERRGGLNLPFT